MYGVLHSDGELDELPQCESACIEDDQLICYDARDGVVGSYSATGSLFGHIETLKRLQPLFRRIAEADAAGT
jgi:hypothetical protein